MSTKESSNNPQAQGTDGEEPDYYFLPNGLLVMTASYLTKRGYCCGNACKHCPYNYENVPEPKRTKLLALLNKVK